jgi:DNA invertase Pin-like site-specific DNA recombinase
MAHLLGAFSELERSMIVERVNAGSASARRRGVKFGRPKTWVSADKVQALRDEGMTWRQIAKSSKWARRQHAAPFRSKPAR